jgi:hypothetical protein
MRRHLSMSLICFKGGDGSFCDPSTKRGQTDVAFCYPQEVD